MIKTLHRPFVAVLVALLAVSTGTSLYGGAAADVAIAHDVGLSAERLLRIDQVVQREIAAKHITGAVTLVARRGHIAHFKAHGLMDIESGKAMKEDTIFRIASMTKPVTGVALLMLVEEGKVRLSDPVSRFIPEFRDTKVAIPISKPAPKASPSRSDSEKAKPEIYTVPADREVTVRDLMTHTSGLVSGGAGAAEANLVAPRKSTDNLAGWAAALGAAPLDFQPGSRWAYSGLAGIDVLARVVEVASGLTFDNYLRERIFEPLGMKDTSFVVSEDKKHRLVTIYRRTPEGLDLLPEPEWVATTTLFSGGGGLRSTAHDYARFAMMLVNNGELDGKRLLGSRTVDLMASNHVGDLFGKQQRTGGRSGKGFGLTVDVVLDSVAAQEHRSTGSFGWGGAFGTNFWVDRKEDMIGVLMVQTPGGSLRADFQNAVMQAIVD